MFADGVARRPVWLRLPSGLELSAGTPGQGLVSTLTTLHQLHEKEAAELLGIRDEMMQVTLLLVANTLGADFKRVSRTPVANITHRNQ